MNELNSIKTIKEIAALEGKAVDDKEVKAIYEKVANTYIDTILSKEIEQHIKQAGPLGLTVKGFIKSCQAMGVTPEQLISDYIKQSFSLSPKPLISKIDKIKGALKRTMYKGIGTTAALGGAGTVGYQMAKNEYDGDKW